MIRKSLITGVCGLALTILSVTGAQAIVPIIWIVVVGVGKAAGAGAVAGKMALTAGILKSAGVGSSFAVKSLVFTKTGSMVLTVTGTALAAEAGSATIDALRSIDYRIDKGSVTRLNEDIAAKATAKQTYQVRYCLDDRGAKLVVPEFYQTCPLGGAPKIGEEFSFKNG